MNYKVLLVIASFYVVVEITYYIVTYLRGIDDDNGYKDRLSKVLLILVSSGTGLFAKTIPNDKVLLTSIILGVVVSIPIFFHIKEIIRIFK